MTDRPISDGVRGAIAAARAALEAAIAKNDETPKERVPDDQ
jgi:hypothetical protein